MLNYRQKCELDKDYAKIIEKAGDVYVELIKVNPDDYENNAVVSMLIENVRVIVSANDTDNAVESDNPDTVLDDVYTIKEAVEAIQGIVEDYEGLTNELQETADCILEKGVYTDLLAALAPYNK